MRVSRPAHSDLGIAIDELIETTRADQRTGNGNTRVDGLTRVGNDSRLSQVDEAIADHSRVHAQVTTVVKQPQDRIGYCADTDLDDGAIFNIVGYDSGYRQIVLANLCSGNLYRQPRNLHRTSDPVGGQHTVTK